MNEPWQPDPAEREPWQQPEAPPADLRHQEDIAAVVAGLHDLGMFKAGEQRSGDRGPRDQRTRGPDVVHAGAG